MSCSKTGLQVHYELPEFTQTHVCWVGDAIQPSLPLCSPLLLLPSIFPSIRVFSSESAVRIRWPKYWSFSSSTSSEYSGLISFRIDWFDLLVVQRTLKTLLQHHSSKASVLQCLAFFMVKLSHPFMTTGKTVALTIPTFVDKVPNKLFGQPSILNWVAYKQKCISRSSGDWEVQDQGISRFSIWWGPHPHKDKNTRELSEVFFYKDTNPIHKGSALLS